MLLFSESVLKLNYFQSLFHVTNIGLIMFHLHSLKEPPPKKMCETINSTSDIQSRIAVSSNPTTCWPVDSQPSCRAQYNGTIPTCGFQLSKKALCQTELAHFSPSGFRNFLGCIIMSKAILSCFICMQQNVKSNLRAARSKNVCFISKGRWRDSRSIKCLSATK